MCPACYAAMAWTVASVTATGGATTVAIVSVAKKVVRRRRTAKQ